MKTVLAEVADQVGNENVLQAILDVIIASRYDLLMLIVGLVSYIILFSARTRWKTAHQSKKVLSDAVDVEGTTLSESSRVVKTTQLALQISNCEHAKAQELIESMVAEQVTLGEEAMNSMLRKCIISGDSQMAMLLEQLARTELKCTDATYSLRLQALSRSSEQSRAVVDEILHSSTTFSFDLVLCILGFCRMSALDRPLADRLLECMKNTVDIDVLSEFIHFYLDSNQYGKACDVFELNFAIFFEEELGVDTEWSLMNSALKCGRLSVANHLFETSQVDAGRHVLKIQNWWRRSLPNLHKGSREQQIGDIFGRLANVFNERFPFLEDSFSEHSSDESTAFFGDDDESVSDFDSDYDASILNGHVY